MLNNFFYIFYFYIVYFKLDQILTFKNPAYLQLSTKQIYKDACMFHIRTGAGYDQY